MNVAGRAYRNSSRRKFCAFVVIISRAGGQMCSPFGSNTQTAFHLHYISQIFQEDIKSLIAHIVENHWDRLQHITYIPTFSSLKARYEQQQDARSRDRTLDTYVISGKFSPKKIRFFRETAPLWNLPHVISLNSDRTRLSPQNVNLCLSQDSPFQKCVVVGSQPMAGFLPSQLANSSPNGTSLNVQSKRTK